MTAFSEFLDPIKTAAPGRTGAAATATDCEGVDAMAILGNTHEEASLTGTGISHVPLAGHPEFGGLLAGATDDDPPSVLIRDGALQIITDDIDLAIAWRNAWQNAVSHLVIHRQRQEGQS